jgi:DNA transformation protein
MAVSPSYLQFVLEQLAGVRRVTHRRMFGGVGLYSDDVFFGVIDNDTVFFKVSDQTRPRYLKRKMPPFAPIPGKPAMMKYYQVPLGVLEDTEALTDWANEAVTAGATVPSAPKPTKKRRAK